MFPETSSKNSQVTGRPKWKKGKRKEPETTAKQLEKKKNWSLCRP